VDTDNWYALFVSAKTPAAVIKTLNEAARKTLATAAVRDRLEKAGAEPASSTPQELEKLLTHDTEKWGKLIKAKNISPEG
jgi:tripartite-type tricarboxylate transporter receptor subunit TctC